MTYALAWPLQKAVFERLSADPAVSAAVGGRIHDGAPQQKAAGADEGLYLILGDDQAVDWSSAERAGAGHLVGISVIAPKRSFAEAKAVAGAISDVLLGAPLALERGQAVLVSFQSARTKREERDTLRRIDLRFRVLVEDTA